MDSTTYQAIPDYQVEPSDIRHGQVEIEAVDDINSDGTIDYQVIYPNGDTQILYLLP